MSPNEASFVELGERSECKLRRIMRQRDHVLAKVVRMQRQVAETPSIGRAKCSVLARMSSKHYDEFAQFHSTVMGLVDLETELEEQEKIYIGFENLYVELNVTLEELTIAFSQEQKEYQKVKELVGNREGLEEHNEEQDGQKQLQEHDKETATGDVALINRSSVSIKGQDQKQLHEQDEETTTDDVTLIKHSSVSMKGQDKKHLQEPDLETTTDESELVKQKSVMFIRYLLLMWGDLEVEKVLFAAKTSVDNYEFSEQQGFDVLDVFTTNTDPKMRQDLLQMHRKSLLDFLVELKRTQKSPQEGSDLCKLINGSYPHIASLIMLGAKITGEAEQFIITMMVSAMPCWIQREWHLLFKTGEIRTLRKLFDFVKKYYNKNNHGHIYLGLKLKHGALHIPEVGQIHKTNMLD